jgi:hypothetical protein
MALVTPRESAPPLQHGDRLSRDEFHRRYEAMPHLHKAELIDRLVYIPSPRNLRFSSRGRTNLVSWLGIYHGYTPGTDSGLNPTVLLDPQCEPQPDTVLMIAEECGGQVRINADGFIEGAPELVADAHDEGFEAKLNVYARNGVKEYLVWRVERESIDWYVLRGDCFDRLQPNRDGWLKSETFPGLWLDTHALLAGDLRRVVEVVQLGLKTPEHAAFLRQLERRRLQA